MKLFGFGKKDEKKDEPVEPTSVSDPVDSQAEPTYFLPLADVYDEQYGGKYPLHAAAADGVIAAIKNFVDQGFDIDSSEGVGVAPIHLAVAEGHLDAVQCLVSLGADVNISDSDGLTPLHVAAETRAGTIVLYLLDNGANARARTSEGATPSDLARRKGYDEFADAIDRLADG